MKIILADDHAMFRDGMVHLLRQLDPDATLIEAADYQALADRANQHGDADLALMDLNMPGGEPFAALESILTCHPTLPVVVLSASENADDMQRVLDLGAMGYIPKRESANIMLSALRLVLSGGIYVPPALMHGRAGSARKADASSPLTPRQLDVLDLLIAGKSNKEIGNRLGLTEATVKAHISATFRALNVTNRTQAVRTAERMGLLAHKAGKTS